MEGGDVGKDILGVLEGEWVGDAVGGMEGKALGKKLGLDEGEFVGIVDGILMLGLEEGNELGLNSLEGKALGYAEG